MLYEKYRPQDWPEVVGQDKIINILKRLESIGKLAGKAYWFSGKSGTGKTTIARIIARKLSEKYNIYEMDAGEIRPDTVKEWAYDQHMRPMGNKTARAYIVNESHALRKDTVRALLVWLEALTPYTVVLFTTTLEGQAHFEDMQLDASPLLSRCLDLRLASTKLSGPFAERMREVALAEGLDGQPIEVYRRWFKDNGLNLRQALQFVEMGGMLT